MQRVRLSGEIRKGVASRKCGRQPSLRHDARAPELVQATALAHVQCSVLAPPSPCPRRRTPHRAPAPSSFPRPELFAPVSARVPDARRRCARHLRADRLLRYAPRACPRRPLVARSAHVVLQYRISRAKHRIFVASLYLGKEETELVRVYSIPARHRANTEAQRTD